jgi:hypothetical protein
MIQAVWYVHQGMEALACLNAIFAQASYGVNWGGNIPGIGTEGQLRITGFAPPLLALRWDVDRGEG